MAHPETFILGAMRLALLSIVVVLLACAGVKPYERGRLAHPSMSGDRLCGPSESHMQAVHEGATGGSMGAESGCGCN